MRRPSLGCKWIGRPIDRESSFRKRKVCPSCAEAPKAWRPLVSVVVRSDAPSSTRAVARFFGAQEQSGLNNLSA